jgi:hypothetical protein
VHQAAEGSSRVQSDMGEVASVAEQTSASTEEVSASTQQTGAAARGRPHANQSGLPSESDENPDRFESCALQGTTAGAPTTAHSLPSMMQLAAKRRTRNDERLSPR